MQQPIEKQRLEALAKTFAEGTSTGSIYEKPYNDEGKLTLSVTGVLLLASIAVDLRRIADAIGKPSASPDGPGGD